MKLTQRHIAKKIRDLMKILTPKKYNTIRKKLLKYFRRNPSKDFKDFVYDTGNILDVILLKREGLDLIEKLRITLEEFKIFLQINGLIETVQKIEKPL